MASDGPDTATAADLSLELSRRISQSHETPVVPGYHLSEVLGRGAFGQVYKAIQQSTGQTVAVKVLFAVTSSFRDEVTRLSRVSDHPSIVTLVDANLDCDPPFLVTPYLPGSLQRHVQPGDQERDLATVARWFEEIARALEFVHARGILHGDLKPANILLGEDGHPRLVDFGQSVALEGQEQRLGSFWFMPWQQAQLPGEMAEVPQVAWDIHALGATMYALLTGQLPRASEQGRQTLSGLSTRKEQVEAYRQLLKTAPLRPVRELNARVDRDLAAIVEGCLGAGGSPVYASASEVVTDLELRRGKYPVKALEGARGYWLERLVARHRVSVSIGLLAIVLLLGGLSWASYQIYQARQARAALIVQQYERGLSLLEQGRASGLVWLANAYRQEPRDEYRRTLEHWLARELSVASPRLYRLQTSTAPSPSGLWAILREPLTNERSLLNLRDGSLSPLPAEIAALNMDQKDTVRYRLDGVVLDPGLGRGGPASWRLLPSDSVSPANQEAILALLVRPDLVLHVTRTSRGFRVLDEKSRVRLAVEGRGFSTGAPTFSNQGDLVVGWDDGRVELFALSDKGVPKVLDQNFRGELFCFSSGGDILAGHDGDSLVRIWSRRGQRLGQIDLGASANDMAFDASAGLLVCVTRDGLVRGYRVADGQPAWAPAEMEKAARWVFVQPNGRIVTMSDEVTVWQPPKPDPLGELGIDELIGEVGLRTGWVYDENARVRTLTRKEYLETSPP